MTQKTNPWALDVRVRERNIKSGALNDKDIEKYLTGLNDVAEQAEPFGTNQPALAQPEPPEVVEEDEPEEEDEPAEESAPEVSDVGGGGSDGGVGGGSVGGGDGLNGEGTPVP
jgi:ribosomal protein L12E/L44/L45/RPP1/RPP2